MFERPEALILLLLLPVMLGVFVWRTRARRVDLARLGEAALIAQLTASVSESRRRWRSGLWLLSAGLAVIALAGPVWGTAVEIVEAQGTAVVFVLDVSASMDAQDLTPSRLERAKLTISEVMRATVGEMLYGLVVFAGDAYVSFPLTSDAVTAERFVQAANSGLMTRQGTVIESALLLALDTLDARIVSDAALVLLSDGENHDGDPLAAAALASARGVPVHVLGYGTEDGDIIPVYNADGDIVRYKTDATESLVISRIEEAILQDIAAESGGRYQRASDSGVEFADLVPLLRAMQGEALSEQVRTRAVSRYALFAGLSLLCLSVLLVLPESAPKKGVEDDISRSQ